MGQTVIIILEIQTTVYGILMGEKKINSVQN